MNNTEDRYSYMLDDLGVTIPDGFFFSPKFYHYQKRSKGIYVYVTPEAFQRWKVQAYITGTAAICSLEARINWEGEGEVHRFSNKELAERYGKNIQKLFNLAESWLQKYGENPEGMDKDPYNPFHPNGWSGKDITTKELYN